MHLSTLMVNLVAQVTSRILIYSATAGYRHDSIPAATAALQQLGRQHEIAFDATEDNTQFNDSNLANYDAILFLSNSEEVLNDSGKQAFQNYLDKGGNFVGIHAASACLYNTTFYRNEVGAFFDYHPELQPVTFLVLDKDHPSTTMLPDRWTYTEEVYNFRSDPRSVGANVLLSVDASSYTDTHAQTHTQGSPHPIAWCQERGAGAADSSTAGRSFYTSLGHLTSTWGDQTFLAHVLGGVQWTLASNKTRAMNPNGQVGAVPPSTSSGEMSTPIG
ncbi:class I glutamine amidotransferase-like protein [Rhizoctonia solani 123E]|uniref:Class I glutamine amidotransferase-like protein n=1 Tax=Rhizoctonia solani 123E TaxID=1423351 RepID=A0A074S027_9AGAM|nr:class I glutamine amidotransferase-like protein [Rhizoctonia solani 123E]